MLTVTDVELRVGARLLMDEVNFRVDKGDKVGLVGRNGAGKTTLTKVLAGGGQPTAGTVTRTGRIGYLPQDPKVEDMDQSGRDRILSAATWTRRSAACVRPRPGWPPSTTPSGSGR